MELILFLGFNKIDKVLTSYNQQVELYRQNIHGKENNKNQAIVFFPCIYNR
jgi:hypothetical protein